MTKRARTLDVIICGIEADRVYYCFPVGEAKLYHADMYSEGKFDLSTIKIEKRYRVKTAQTPCQVRNRKTGRVSTQQKYVWIDAKEVAPQAPLQTHTAKQRKAKESLAALPLVDNGTLFMWRTNL